MKEMKNWRSNDFTTKIQKLATRANVKAKKQPARVGEGKPALSGKTPRQKMLWI